MTAGERNCYLAIEQCLLSYSMDNLLCAVVAHVEELAARQKPGSAEKRLCADVARRINEDRGWIGGIK